MPRSNYCRPASSIALDSLTRWIRRQGKQKEIAAAIGISPQLMYYKSRNNAFTAEDLIKIFHYLQTDPAEIAKILTY